MGLRGDEEKADPTMARAGTQEGDGESGSIPDYIRCWYRPKLNLNLIRVRRRPDLARKTVSTND